MTINKKDNFKDLVNSLPNEVIKHLKDLIAITGLNESEEIFISFVDAWIVKRALFDRIIEHGNFKKIKQFDTSCSAGCIALTISGSLITIGPLDDKTRKTTYTAIGIRTDVPEIRTEEKSILNNSISIHHPISFEKGPVKVSSMVLDMGTTIEEVNHDEITHEINITNKLLQQNFININKNFLNIHIRTKGIIGRNDLFEQWIVLDWFRIGGMEQYIFYGRTKFLWLELFTPLYNLLLKKEIAQDQMNQLFLNITNRQFGNFIDVYKWLESEKKDFDIGLLKALEEIPSLEQYDDFKEKIIKEINKQ